MDGYNRGYPGYQPQPPSQLYGGSSGRSDGGGRNLNSPQTPSHHPPAQAFYGSQHAGFQYNFNYVPPPISGPASSHPPYSSRMQLPPMQQHPGYPASPSAPPPPPPGSVSGGGYSIMNPSPSQSRQTLTQHHRPQHHAPGSPAPAARTNSQNPLTSTYSSPSPAVPSPRYINPAALHPPVRSHHLSPSPSSSSANHRQSSQSSSQSHSRSNPPPPSSSAPLYINPSSLSSSSRIPAPTTLEDTLQYTPVSSVLPFHGCIIPSPTIDASSLAAQSEAVGHKLLHDINRLDPMSKRFRNAMNDVASSMQTISRDKRLQLEFKKSKSSSTVNNTGKTSLETLLQNSKLGVLEKAVLNKLPTFDQKSSSLKAVGDSLPTFDNSTSPRPAHHKSHKTPSKPSTAVPKPEKTPSGGTQSNFYIAIPSLSSLPPQPPQSQQRRRESNGYDSVVAVSTLEQQPEATPASRVKALPDDHQPTGQVLAAVILPPPKEGFTPADYTTHEQADAKILVSADFKARKRRKIGESDDHEALIASVDTRAKAESAVTAFQNLLISLFEAEDNLQPDTSGNIAAASSAVFIPPGALGYSPETTGQCFSLGIQVKLDHAIRQVNLYNRLDKMELDDILRMLKSCDNTLKAAENLDVKVGENSTDEAADSIVSEYDRRIAFADNSVKTCRTILRVMNGGRQEKQIYSEELLTSIHNVIKNLLEGSVLPLIALRSEKDNAFKTAMSKKKILRELLQDIIKVIRLLTQLLSTQEVTEDFLIKMLYTSVPLVFIENATNDKESIFGVNKVENLRLAAMNTLAKIFSRYPDQGDAIINEVLSNLEKLPVSRQSAKNFKLPEGGSIQLISAFMMNLVQSAGTYQERGAGPTGSKVADTSDDEMTNGHAEPGKHPNFDHARDAITVMQRLEQVSDNYLKTAQQRTAYVTHYIVSKALVTAKSSEGNSRNLLDLMVEDFIQVLANPEWPAAEMFLKTICVRMIRTVDDPKSSVPAKSAALELLGKLGSCINDLFTHLKDLHRNHSVSGSIDGMLSILTENYLNFHQNTENKAGNEIKEEREEVLRKMVLWKGPFRIILEHLWEKDQKPDADNLQTSWGFFASVWAGRLIPSFEQTVEIDASFASDIAHVADNLRKMITEKAWYDEEDEVDAYRRVAPTSMQIRQAYLLIILASDFCSHSRLILARLIFSIDGEQTSARSKGLKALMNLVEKDTSILEDRGLIPTLLGRCKDASPQVRDSALDIIGRCLALKPDLEARVLPTICTRAHDTNVPLRKRAIKLLRDIYPSTKIPEHKVDIAKCLLMRVGDHEAGVAEQAKKSFEELWINQSFPQLKDGEDGELSLKGKLIIKERVGIITKVVTTNDKLDAPLSNLIQFFLDIDNKQVEQNSKVCRLMVRALFDDLIDSAGNDDDKLRRQSIMRTLVVFARASANLFKVDQLDLLKPYIKDLSSADDMSIYRSAIVIFRCVLPGLSAAHSKFLEDVATALLSNVSKLPMTELQEAIFCLSEINKSYDISVRLQSVFCSSLNILKPHFQADTRTLEPQVQRKIARLICIVGLVGSYCPLERYSRDIKLRLAKFGLAIKSPTIAEFIVDTMLGFARENAEPSIRKAALDAVGNVAKSYPDQYMRASVTSAFEKVLQSDEKDFKSLILKSLYEFLSAEEKSSEEALKRGKAPAASKESVAAADYDPGRLTGASTATSRDGVSTALAQTFLHYIVRIALSSVDDYGFAAVELTGSVLRQGLVHPKECTPALVALGTCPDVRIQNVAFRELKTLAQKHESIVERAYMDGFRLAFNYQLEVINSEDGADDSTFASKLGNLYALTVTSRKVKKKFLGNLLNALDFEPHKLQVSAIPSHLTYARFILQNLAYFDYVSIEDVHQVASGLEKIVGNIGATVVHHIETDVHQISLETAEPKPVDPLVKRRLCMASVVLTMCWSTRTYLRKLYSVTADSVARKAKNGSKELTKAPTKAVGMSGRSLWDEMGELIETLEADEGMDNQLREFVELLTVDNEFKRITEQEDEDLFGGGGDGDDDDDAGGADATPHRGRGRPKKRKTGNTPPPTKAKRRKKKEEGTPGHDDGDDD
ncbi:hypothetical protein Dda_6247 [Drechslerella dactyloides]|uniref:Sister chromatid cohesion protein n=1 Tax=Drechslerella dactyloides TaxID=74499 RepID=A0AAD6IZQ1_DREDA|nr:hypothetical protein Dda_6247 [Drechslerella dactyloides]